MSEISGETHQGPGPTTAERLDNARGEAREFNRRSKEFETLLIKERLENDRLRDEVRRLKVRADGTDTAAYELNTRLSEKNKGLLSVAEELRQAMIRNGNEAEALKEENERLVEANHAVAVCSEHTDEIVRPDGIANGCWLCHARRLDGEIKKLQLEYSDFVRLVHDQT